MTEKLRTILNHFTGVRPSAGESQFQADCPCLHHSKTNNKHLAVTCDDSGKIAIHCFAGCYIDEILSEVGLKIRDLFPDQSEEEKRRYRDNIAGKRIRQERDTTVSRLWTELSILQQVIGARLFSGEMDIEGRYQAWDREKTALRILPKLLDEYYRQIR